MDMTSYRNGIRSKGFGFSVPVAGLTQTLTLSGLAKQFEGIKFTQAATATPGTPVQGLTLRLTLTINNDVVIDDDIPYHYGADTSGGYTSGFPAYVPFPRALTGQDTIILRITNTSGASQDLDVCVFYRNEIWYFRCLIKEPTLKSRLFFRNFNTMSWSIPTKIEADIQAGLAEYKTFQTGNGGQTVLQVPSNAYIVIFGMDYQPGGGAICEIRQVAQAGQNLNNFDLERLATQQVSFFTGNQFYPFIFHAPYKFAFATPSQVVGQILVGGNIDSTSIARSLYISSNQDVTVTVGLIYRNVRNTAAAIPVSNSTPPGITYGGNPQTTNVQTDFNTGTPQITQFLQPNPELFEILGFGLAPAGQSDQAYAKPDAADGLRPIDNLLSAFGGTALNSAACNYFLTLHYAIYSSAPNERFI